MNKLRKLLEIKTISVIYILIITVTCNKTPASSAALILEGANLDIDIKKNGKLINNMIFPEDTIIAKILNSSSAPVENIRVEFVLADTVPGQLFDDVKYTNSSGQAWTLYHLDPQDIENINFTTDTSFQIEVFVSAGEDENSMSLHESEIWDTPVSYQGDPNQVNWFNFSNPTNGYLFNFNLGAIDTITATAINQDGVAVCNVPVYFSIQAKFDSGGNSIVDHETTQPFGILNKGVAFTCIDGDPEFGEVNIIYKNINVGTDELFAKIVNTEDDSLILFSDSMYVYNIEESDIETFSSDTAHYFHFYPNNNEIINLASDSTIVEVIAKNKQGSRICDVPVYFRLESENGQDAHGFINTNIAITCEDSTNSTATVTYQNINGGIDYLIASLIGQEEIAQDTIMISTVGSSLKIDDVSSINSNSVSGYLIFTNMDSIKTDTIFSRALDDNLSLIPGIPFEYSLINEDLESSAFLSASGAISDSNGVAYTILNVQPSIFSSPDEPSKSITININIPSTAISSSEDVQLINQLPVWNENSAKLILSTDIYVLPCEECTNPNSTIITATLLDSIDVPCPNGTIIEFSSLQKDTLNGETVWNPMGNITPGVPFSNGQAEAEFFTSDDRGIAHIIGKVDEFSLSDTIQIVVESTSASHIQIIPPAIDEIMVQGGGGTESSLVQVHIVDDFQNIVIDEEYLIHFEITGGPEGITLDNSGVQELTKTTDFGTSNITIVSGTAPGSVQLTVKLFNLTDDVNSASPIDIAENIPVTVVTGPPEYGQLNFSFLGIIADEIGAVYHVPLSVYLEDLHSNPVADSTSVYFKIREVADTYDSESIYGFEDKVTWLSPDSTSISELDSLVYTCISETFGCPIGTEPSASVWEVAAYPAFIIGEGETNMPNSDGNSYPGIAYSEITYGSASIASEIIIFAQTYSTDNSTLIIDSRDTHNGDGVILPCYNCQLSMFVLPTQWDFSLPPFDPDAETDFQDVTVQITVTDHFQYYVNNALISLDPPQANFTFVCGGDDTDLDEITGSCVNATDANDILSLVDTCWECAEYNPDYVWIIEDTDSNDVADVDGTLLLIPDDIPNYARTNASGIGLYYIRYSEGVNIPTGDNPVTYQTFNTTLTATLLTPSTNGPTATTTIVITKSEED